MNKKDKVKVLLNVWDPIELFPFSPIDEYSNEIEEVILKMEGEKDLSVDKLSKIIYEVYKGAFEETFILSKNDCNWISERILELIL